MTDLAEFLTGIGSVFTQGVTWLGTMSTALIGNPIFMVTMGLILFTMFFGLVIGLGKGIRGRKKRR